MRTQAMAAELCIILSFVHASNGEWVSHNGMPHADQLMVIGYYDDIVYILGGQDNPKQMTRFTVQSEQFSSYQLPEYTLPRDTMAYSSSFVQIGNQLYLIDRWIPMLNVYTMSNNLFVSNYSLIPASNVGYTACLTGSSTHLFVVGGGESNAITTVQILDMQTRKWSVGPHMHSARSYLSCITHPTNSSISFAIGGYNIGTSLSSIERIDIASFKSEYVDSLTQGLSRTRAIIYGELVYIIGGRYYGGSDYAVKKVHTLDPNTGSVVVTTDRLAYGVYGMAAITVGNKMYAFGGRGDSSNLDTWMKYTLYVHT